MKMFSFHSRFFALAALCVVASVFNAPAAETAFSFELSDEKLAITDGGNRVADYVFKDSKILRPHFANVCAPGGLQVTRNHPPLEGKDAADHSTMHPGIWLAFGDISGHDFWRNKGTIQHDRFLDAPRVHGSDTRKTARDRLFFTTRNRLLSAEGAEVCVQTSKIRLFATESGYLLVWEAIFESEQGDFSFGDQEEMGFGVRLATPLAEKNGGVIRNSAGEKSATATWGKTADWCDYSGLMMGRQVGGTIMPDPANFRPSWFHNRDYGLMVANPFGRKAFKQGEPSRVIVKKNTPFRIAFGALLHSTPPSEPISLPAAYADFLKILSEK